MSVIDILWLRIFNMASTTPQSLLHSFVALPGVRVPPLPKRKCKYTPTQYITLNLISKIGRGAKYWSCPWCCPRVTNPRWNSLDSQCCRQVVVYQRWESSDAERILNLLLLDQSGCYRDTDYLWTFWTQRRRWHGPRHELCWCFTPWASVRWLARRLACWKVRS